MSGHHHQGDGTGKALLVTVIVNLALTAIKWVAFAITGSPSLFGEAAHSSADALNPILLWVGRKRGARPTDGRHQFGHGRETFFWSLIAALMMLVGGSLLTAWHGIETLISGTRPQYSWIALAIMGCAFIAESYSFIRSWKELGGEGKAVKRLRESRDSVLLGIIFENGADVLTVTLALCGFGLCALTGDARWDGAFSLLIALLLAASSVFLINRNRSLLIGETAPAEVVERIAAVVRGRPSVTQVVALSTMMRDPHHVACRIVLRWNTAWFSERWNSMPDATPGHPKCAAWTVMLVSNETENIRAAIRRDNPEVTDIEIQTT